MNYILRHAHFELDGQMYVPGDMVDITPEEYERNPRIWEPVPFSRSVTDPVEVTTDVAD